MALSFVCKMGKTMSFGDEISRMTHNHLMSSVVIIGLSFFFFHLPYFLIIMCYLDFMCLNHHFILWYISFLYIHAFHIISFKYHLFLFLKLTMLFSGGEGGSVPFCATGKSQ